MVIQSSSKTALALFRLCLSSLVLIAAICSAGNYTNFDVAIYIPVGVVQSFSDPQKLADDWAHIGRQLKVDKVYIEVQRNRQVADDALLEQVKKFFLDHGVQIAGGMALSDGSIGGQFKSFCYTDPKDRAFVKSAAELAARHFDEVIQDDFFFNTTKNESDIAAKGNRSWTQFRLALMDDVAKNLIVKPAKAVNPKVKMVVKFPNWYEHFQGLGYDLDKGPKIFDGIYTGTETRDAEITDQHLQPYESYQIVRYFENIAPGRNGGGWVDTYDIRFIDRYAEQLWNTMFAKTREQTLFNWADLLHPIKPGDRAAWEKLPTSFNFDEMVKGNSDPTMARVAGYSLEQVDAFVGKLGNPIGIASYKPFQSTGEDFLHNFLGMIGIPIDLHPEFPTNANLVLLTECAKFDPAIVAKIKGQLVAGKNVVITSGLLRALSGKGIEDIVEVRYTDRKFLTHEYLGGFGAGRGALLDGDTNADVLFPEIIFLTNDAWPVVRAIAGDNGFPLLLMDRYAKGVLYVWTIPENFSDLYALPPAVTSAIKDQVMRDFPIRLDGASKVAFFAYDNDTFIVESYLPAATDVKVSVTGNFVQLRNLVTGETISGQAASEIHRRWQPNADAGRTSFKIHLPPHSYAAFVAEK
jgi:hypothetical protein